MGSRGIVEEMKSLPEDARKEKMCLLLGDETYRLLDDDTVNEQILESNSSGFLVDVFDVEDVEVDNREVTCRMTFSLVGDDAGISIDGSAKFSIDSDGYVSFSDVEAEMSEVLEPVPEAEEFVC